MELHVRPMAAGAVDLVGDVHGELYALERLLRHLGYAEDGSHPEGRSLVFLGDLVDRGPDSLGVVRRVRDLVDGGRAQCVLGNHELNLLLGKRRAGNDWFWGERQLLRGGEAVIEQRLLNDAEREEVLFFVQQLPLALERAELRAVHACWHTPVVEALRGERRGLADLFYATERDITLAASEAGHAPESLHADIARQNENPVTALTSGLERPTAVPFRAGGRERRVERVPWWEGYDEEQSVVFGHYWRAVDPERRPAKRGPYLFEGLHWGEPLGPRRNAWCIDLGVGARNVHRAGGDDHAHTALVAMRHPEYLLVDDRGEIHEPLA